MRIFVSRPSGRFSALSHTVGHDAPSEGFASGPKKLDVNGGDSRARDDGNRAAEKTKTTAASRFVPGVAQR